MTNGKKVNNKYGTFKSVNLMFTMLMLHPLSKHYCYASNNREKVRQKLPRSSVVHSVHSVHPVYISATVRPPVHSCARS